jgi:hypothetical protein
MTTNLALEEEFFAAEGRPQPGAGRACAYVAALGHAPNGDPLTAEMRAALWYLAFWSMDGVTRPSVAALAMHIDCTVERTRCVLAALLGHGILKTEMGPLSCVQSDVHVYQFRELQEQTG